ncbi:MAG: heparinase II/III-family protein, partial [Chloroflexota bacterium]|nr:heparinase II/III-family protein [Chloroflexota bacterium]
TYGRRKMLIRLVTAECVESEGRFIDDIINGVWAICEESFWDVPAHNRYVTSAGFMMGPALPDVKNPVVALFSAETGQVIAFTHYLVDAALDKVEPTVTDRMRHEIRTRLLDPFMERDDWWWLGFVQGVRQGPPNNWNPWIISNLLAMELLIEDDEERRAAAIHRALRGLDKFLAGYHADGGCDEGISYWGRAGACVYECLDVLDRSSNGAIAVWDEPLIQEIARYVYRAHVGGEWYVNFADGTARTIPDPNIVYHFGEKIGDETLMTHAIASQAQLDPDTSEFRSFPRFLNTVFRPVPRPGTIPPFPLVRQSWLDGIQVLTARETDGTDDGLFLAAKGGHNGESHNHNDIGSFIVGLDGQPVLIDAGVEDYTKKTFSPQRYEIWTMQSAYHNLPTINGHQQSPGEGYQARAVVADLAGDHAELRLDIAGAWDSAAGVERWDRTARLERGAVPLVVIEDAWQMGNFPGSIVLTLMAAGAVDSSSPGQLRLTGPKRDLVVEYDADQVSVATERIDIDDRRMTPVWGEFVTRVLLAMKDPQAAGSITLRIHA